MISFARCCACVLGLLLCGCGGSRDTYLACNGNIVVWTAAGAFRHQDERIAAHITRSKAIFSGNKWFETVEAPLCSSQDSSKEDLTFSTEPCSQTETDSETWTFAKLNKIIGTLELRHHSGGKNGATVLGEFKCEPTKPQN
jgi:hypothetical protein